MDADRIATAMERIEAAARRIEAAAAAAPSGPAGDPALQRRYDSLRKEAGAALQQLDLLIGTLER